MINIDTPPDWYQVCISLTEKQLYQLSNDLSGAVFLDNNSANGTHGYTIFSAMPLKSLEYDLSKPDSNLLSLLEKFRKKTLLKCSQAPVAIKKQPFLYGIMAYCSYSLGERIQVKKKPNIKHSHPNTDFPDLYAGYYTWSYVFNHEAQQGYLTFSPLCTEQTRNEILDIIHSHNKEKILDSTELAQLNWKKSQTFEKYAEQFAHVQQYILNGDCYQVNLTQRFEAFSDKEAVDLYFSTRKSIHMPFSCFIAFNQQQHLLSFSPEQFITIDQRHIESKPIKGTIINDGTESTKQTLISSKKNQAENVMIVDLLRNDLGKVCQANSIHVPELFKLETYKNVHHLVSKICGTLKPEITELEAFLASFPGGSITGAPKIRAMEIIKELEVYSRSAYCGSVFYLNYDGKFDSNILIRTVTKNKNILHCWAGGGIVADSDLLEEYQESLTKVANITGIKS